MALRASMTIVYHVCDISPADNMKQLIDSLTGTRSIQDENDKNDWIMSLVTIGFL